jgi:Phage integrase, N-terminal SAM-like domain/Arm DNA-binding domain
MQGSFVKKRGSTWTAYYYVPDSSGNRRQRTKGGFHTKAEAQAYLNNKITSVQSGDFVEPSKLLFGEYLTEHWLPIAKRSIRPSTWDSYRRMIELHVLPTLGGIAIQRLTHNHLDRLYTELLENGKLNAPGGLSPKTVRYLHNTLHKALRRLRRVGASSRWT